MKTLAHERCKAEILRRLRDVRPDSARRWGRMSAHQMVCHLTDSCRMALGEKPVSFATGPVQQTVVKWIALYLPLKWPPGYMTRPEIDQEGWRHVSGRFRRGRRGTRGTAGRFHGEGCKLRLAGASGVRPDVESRLAPVGVRAHGPPPASVRRVNEGHADASGTSPSVPPPRSLVFRAPPENSISCSAASAVAREISPGLPASR